MDQFKAIRKEYPGTLHQVYLDTSTTGLFSKTGRDAMVDFIDRRHHEGIPMKGYWGVWQEADDWRAVFADMIGAGSEEVFFGKDSSDMMNVFISTIPVPEGSHVLIPDISFPSTRNAWLNRERDGIEVRYLKNTDGVVTTDDLIESINDKTFAVSICSVEPSSGYQYEIARLGRICRERGVYFVVDATQSLGAMDLDVVAMNIDVMVASTYKWLCNVFGFGAGYIRAEVLEKITPRHVGWTGVKDRIKDFNKLSFDLHPGARRFETGGLNWVGLAGIKASVATYTGLGKQAVEARILGLVDRLYEAMKTVPGVEIHPSLPGVNRSSIVYLRLKEGHFLSQEVLDKAHVRVNLAGRSIRVGIHFYNDEADIDALVAVLEKI